MFPAQVNPRPFMATLVEFLRDLSLAKSLSATVTLMTASFVLIMHPKMSTQAAQSAVTAAAGDDDDDDILSWSFKPKISGIAMVQIRLSSCPRRL